MAEKLHEVGSIKAGLVVVGFLVILLDGQGTTQSLIGIGQVEVKACEVNFQVAHGRFVKI